MGDACTSITVDTVLFTATSHEEENYRKLPGKELRVLLLRRAEEPFQQQWALPGGTVCARENLDEAAARTLQEETGLERIYLEQLYTWGAPERDPRCRTVSCTYLALANAAQLEAEQDATGVVSHWFTVQESLLEEKKVMQGEGFRQERTSRLTLTADDAEAYAIIRAGRYVGANGARTDRTLVDCSGLAFDHGMIIQYGLERLRSKIEWTDLAFHLMPERFTLTELQQVYELILGRELLTANFRRKTAHMVQETNAYKRDAGHRPAKLYRFDPDWEAKQS